MKSITPACYNILLTEINDIKQSKLPAVAEEIALARSHGDLRENAQYSAAKEKQRMIEARLVELEEAISTYTVVDICGKKFDFVAFGATIEIQFLDDQSIKKFQILSDYDADINKGIISINAPIVKGLLGLKECDEAEVTLAGKTRNILIKKIS